MQKIKTVWILLRSHVVTLPPIMTVIECLLDSESYNVNFISTQSSNLTHPNLKEYILPQSHNVSKISKIKNYIKYRMFVDKVLTDHSQTEDIVWLGSLDTAIACKGLIFLKKNPYVLHLHELYDTHLKKLKVVKTIAQNAKYVVVPELNRAGILQVWLELKNRPTVLPNKPYRHPRDKKLIPTHRLTQSILEKYKTDKPIVLYQGHIGGDRNLMPIAQAMKMLPDYEFWLLGTDHGSYSEQLLAISDNIKYLGSVPAPYHLEITSYASIGIMSYDPINLNNLYCAPNKLWEYSGFGIPFLSNKCLSLEGSQMESIGISIDWQVENILKSLKRITNKELEYEKNAINFYNNCDVVSIIEIMVN